LTTLDRFSLIDQPDQTGAGRDDVLSDRRPATITSPGLCLWEGSAANT
jgi:hypothetical protein